MHSSTGDKNSNILHKEESISLATIQTYTTIYQLQGISTSLNCKSEFNYHQHWHWWIIMEVLMLINLFRKINAPVTFRGETFNLTSSSGCKCLPYTLHCLLLPKLSRYTLVSIYPTFNKNHPCKPIYVTTSIRAHYGVQHLHKSLILYDW